MQTDIGEIRRAFPHLQSCVYMNTAAVGICPRGLGAVAARFYDDYRSRGFDGREAWRTSELQVQSRLARLLNASEEEIGFTGSTTEALNLVARSMRILPGEQIVFAADDFPSVQLAWEPYRRSGVELVAVKIENEDERTAALAAAVGPRTRVLCVSHVHWCTGTRVDLDVLAAACRRHGARLIVDGTQAVGAVDVDVSSADVYAGSVFKWLLSAFGLAFLFVKQDLQEQLEPAIRGYANEPGSNSLRYAHANYPAIDVLGASLDYLESIGWSVIFDRVASLTGLLHEELRSAGWQVVTPHASRAGIVSIEHNDARGLVSRLSERGCSVELRDGLVRFSPHFYNTEDEVRHLLKLLEQIS